MLITPTIIPILLLSFCYTRLVAKARAFGGVEIGRIIALDAAIATPIRTVEVPPITFRLSPIAVHTTARIGISKAAVAELDMKFESR